MTRRPFSQWGKPDKQYAEQLLEQPRQPPRICNNADNHERGCACGNRNRDYSGPEFQVAVTIAFATGRASWEWPTDVERAQARAVLSLLVDDPAVLKEAGAIACAEGGKHTWGHVSDDWAGDPIYQCVYCEKFNEEGWKP